MSMDSATAAHTTASGATDVEAGLDMIRRRVRDPWWGDEGKGAKRTRRRTQIEGLLALVLAIVACGLSAAVWLRQLAPLARQLGLG
jgi:hypothetical protein